LPKNLPHGGSAQLLVKLTEIKFEKMKYQKRWALYHEAESCVSRLTKLADMSVKNDTGGGIED